MSNLRPAADAAHDLQVATDLASSNARESTAATAGSNAAASSAPGAPPPRIAYLVNQYPKASHTFIRREIHAVERNGLAIDRISIRGWESDIVDPEDKAEHARTRFILRDGTAGLAASSLRILARRPAKFLAALRAALRLGWRSDRALPYHLVYLAEACRLAEWLEASDIKHLHAHFATNSAEVAMLARLLGGPPYSFTAHGGDEYDRYAQLGIGEKVRHSRFTVAISSHTRSQLFRRTALDQWPKIQVVHCGLDRGFFDGDPVPLPPENRVICVGRLTEEKGQLVLLDALAKARARGVDCSLVLAGDGHMRAEVEARIRTLGLTEQVRITGWISSAKVRDEILAARALVCSSFQEGLPVVIMEAMALRRPVISTTIAGIPELVQPGATGWLVPAGSADSLAAALASLCATPTAELERMGETAYRRVTERHDIETVAAQLAQLFKQSVAGNGSEPCPPS